MLSFYVCVYVYLYIVRFYAENKNVSVSLISGRFSQELYRQYTFNSPRGFLILRNGFPNKIRASSLSVNYDKYYSLGDIGVFQSLDGSEPLRGVKDY